MTDQKVAEEAFTITVMCQGGRFDEIPITMPERCYQLIATAFAELLDEGVVEILVTLPGKPSSDKVN